jgi:mannose-6-phosphate isomerase-like protein (cupin superfamily)
MYMVVRKSLNTAKRISGNKMTLNEIVPNDQRISLDFAEVIDHYEKTIAAYNRIYYIAEGHMQFYFNNQLINLQKGDACFVEKGMHFELKGTFTVIIVSHHKLYV